MSRYVLLTAAYNEAKFIGQTIESVISQTVLPVRWIIVSDGSSDGTDEIVRGYAARCEFIQFRRVDSTEPRGTVRKVKALDVGYRELQGLNYTLLGNVDADVSLPKCYFELLGKRFQSDPALGIGGGLIYEKHRGEFRPRLSNNERSVAHAAQVVRRECYEEIGGYLPLKYGGEDWCAEVNARMNGWTVKSFADLRVMHHKATGSADRALRHRFRQGKMDYAFGSHPVFELFKCARRIPDRPFAVGAIARLLGFTCSWAKVEPREVPLEFMGFLRREQKQRLKFLLNGFSGLGRRLNAD
jgi:glycosyltransferase involved in cell wall biosynthesis